MQRATPKNAATRTIGKQIFEVKYNDKRIFNTPRNRKEQLLALKSFVTRECDKCWRLSEEKVATLKRQYLHELLQALD